MPILDKSNESTILHYIFALMNGCFTRCLKEGVFYGFTAEFLNACYNESRKSRQMTRFTGFSSHAYIFLHGNGTKL